MPKILNESYRKFLDEGIIDLINQEDIIKVLENVDGIRGKHIREARSLIITFYLTGARPNEVLKIKARDVYQKGHYIFIKMTASKGGVPRTIPVKSKNLLANELLNYASEVFPDFLLFYNFKSTYNRKCIGKEGFKESIDTTNNLRYYFKKWFKILDRDVNPYFLRHNRFSQLSTAGATLMDIRLLKGSKSLESVTPYIHMSTESLKKVAKKIE